MRDHSRVCHPRDTEQAAPAGSLRVLGGPESSRLAAGAFARCSPCVQATHLAVTLPPFACLPLPWWFTEQMVSLYLAYVLFAILEDTCLVCMGIYVVNFTLLVLSYRRFKGLSGAASTAAADKKTG